MSIFNPHNSRQQEQFMRYILIPISSIIEPITTPETQSVNIIARFSFI